MCLFEVVKQADRQTLWYGELSVDLKIVSIPCCGGMGLTHRTRSASHIEGNSCNKLIIIMPACLIRENVTVFF